MMRFGGGFVSALGNALQSADDANERLIRQTWPEYIAKYTLIAEQLKQEDDAKP